jgi:hypothetical protein
MTASVSQLYLLGYRYAKPESSSGLREMHLQPATYNCFEYQLPNIYRAYSTSYQLYVKYTVCKK